jgi:hypothetical protein
MGAGYICVVEIRRRSSNERVAALQIVVPVYTDADDSKIFRLDLKDQRFGACTMAAPAILQVINSGLHKEPLSTIYYTIYWSLLLLASAPICVIVLIFRALDKLIFRRRPKDLLFYKPSLINQKQYVDDKTASKIELAIFITGCDTGFGKEIALRAASDGFVVFAGCFDPTSIEYLKVDSVQPLLVDVTKDNQVEQAAKAVNEWIQAGEKKGTKRVLHAIINNAGVGVVGLIDWMDLTTFQAMMDGT